MSKGRYELGSGVVCGCSNKVIQANLDIRIRQRLITGNVLVLDILHQVATTEIRPRSSQNED